MGEDIEKKSLDPKEKERRQPTGGPQPVDPREEMKIDSNLGQPPGGKS